MKLAELVVELENEVHKIQENENTKTELLAILKQYKHVPPEAELNAEEILNITGVLLDDYEQTKKEVDYLRTENNGILDRLREYEEELS